MAIMARAMASLDIFHAIADANRRVLLDRLASGEAPVSALVDEVGLSYSAVSQHLAVLLEVGLVTRREDGRQRIYRLEPQSLRVVHDWTSHYEKFWKGKLARLRKVIEEDS